MLFSVPELSSQEKEIIAEIENVRKNIGYSLNSALPKKWAGTLYRHVLAGNIRASNTIEGYEISKDDALAIVDEEEPLDAKSEAWYANLCYRRAMNYVLQMAQDPSFEFSAAIVKSLHFMMMEYDQSKTPGNYRPGYIGVKKEKTGEVIYEGPDAQIVPSLMQEFVASFDASSSDPYIRAAMAHLNFVMIHPFRDGNGRMARCLQTLSLVRNGLSSPLYFTLEGYIWKNVDAYYDKLAEVGQGQWSPQNDPTTWIRFCLDGHLFQAKWLLNRTKEIDDLWARLEAAVATKNIPERCVLALFDAAQGYKVRNKQYSKSAQIDEQVAGNDLRKMCEAGLLGAEGKTKGRFYTASIALKAIKEGSKTKPVPIILEKQPKLPLT